MKWKFSNLIKYAKLNISSLNIFNLAMHSLFHIKKVGYVYIIKISDIFDIMNPVCDFVLSVLLFLPSAIPIRRKF